MSNAKRSPGALKASAFMVLLAIALLVLGCSAALADVNVSSSDLIENPDRYDGRRVRYRGEAIGFILSQGEGAWVTVNDDHYHRRHIHEHGELEGANSGIAVHGPAYLFAPVRVLGSYTARGDIVEASGVFHRANPAYGGDLMIEADELRVVSRGYPVGGHGWGNAPLIAVSLLLVSALLGLAVLKQRPKAVARRHARALAGRS